MPTVYDNITPPFLENAEGNGLKDALKVAWRGDFCVGYFNLRGWRCIDSVVDGWQLPADPDAATPCRLLVGMQRLPNDQLKEWLAEDDERLPDNKRLAKLRKDAANEFRKQLTLGFPTNADEAGLRRLVKQLQEGRLRVKLFLKHALHAKLYLAHRDDGFNPIIAYLGSSNLTLAGLKAQGELNIEVPDKDAAKKLHDWFVDRWEDSRCLDITEELIEIIEESWAGDRLVPPYHVYLKMAWHLSQDAREGIKEFRVPGEIRDQLMPFQEKAVQLACRHLNKRGGVLVGDVVGLGKTRIASAIARVMSDDQMLETLILCPKNLTTMWEDYAHRFGLRAPKVISQSTAQRDLPKLPRYRLVLIDESHNFRNREGKIYQAIRECHSEQGGLRQPAATIGVRALQQLRRGLPAPAAGHRALVVLLHGFHTPVEKDVLAILARRGANILLVSARDLPKTAPKELQPAAEEGRPHAQSLQLRQPGPRYQGKLLPAQPLCAGLDLKSLRSLFGSRQQSPRDLSIPFRHQNGIDKSTGKQPSQ